MNPTVVVGYDQTPHSERALIEAGREAAWRGASLTVAHAFSWIPAGTPAAYALPTTEQAVRQTAMQIAEHGADLARSRYPGMTVHALAGAGPAAEALARAARAADLLVVGNRGRGGFTGLLLGSVSMRVLNQAPCPTMVVRGSEHDPRDTVLVAVDLEETADEDLLEFAFAEASRRGAGLEVITAWDLAWATWFADNNEEAERDARQAADDLRASLQKRVNGWQAKYPDVRVHLEVGDGAPGAVLVEASKRADLVVAGAHRYGAGRHGDVRVGMRVGPVAHAVLHHADCSVVIVPIG